MSRIESSTRSEVMSRIRGSDTEPELLLRKELWARGLRYILHDSSLPGTPDLVFKGPQVAVFVDGCFWHGCPDHYVRPRSRPQFWNRKLRKNVERDQRQTRELSEAGYRVQRYWEHEVFGDLDQVAGQVEAAVRADTEGDLGEQRPRAWRVLEAHPSREGTGEKEIERWLLTDLRDPGVRKTIHRERSTEKW